MYIEHASPNGRRRLGPYSRKLTRGAIADAFDGRSVQGRFIRDLERQLIQHIGGSPSITQKLLITRIIRLHMRLDLFEEKLTNEPDKWSSHDDRVYGGIQSAYRLALRELGFKPAPAPQVRSIHDLWSRPNSNEAAE